jgi:peptide/nickel transport system ATP-binding protein
MADSPLLSVRESEDVLPAGRGDGARGRRRELRLAQGATLGIVGESGCGKSITARSILRIVDRPGRIIEGEIHFRRPSANGGGADRRPRHARRRTAPRCGDPRGEIALIFQEPMSSFSPVHSVGNQIIEAIRLHQPVERREARTKTIEILRASALSSPEQRVDQLAYQLSGGLRQRAMIAMACPASRPCDRREPTTALDVTTQNQILELMRQLQQEDGMAIMPHHTRSRRGRRDGHRRGGDVPGTGDRAGAGRRDLPRAPPPLHAGAAALDPPHPRRERKRLTPIAGAVPHPYDRPPAARSIPRCPEFMAGRCDRAGAALKPVGDRHAVSCFLYE